MTLKYTDSDLSAALAKGREEALEEAAQIAEGSSGPFPKGQRIAADGTEGTELAIAMQHSLGGGRDAIAAAIRALSPSSPGEPAGSGWQPPEGWVLVPREPTKAMLCANREGIEQAEGFEPLETARDTWRAMIEAAPPHEPTGET